MRDRPHPCHPRQSVQECGSGRGFGQPCERERPSCVNVRPAYGSRSIASELFAAVLVPTGAYVLVRTSRTYLMISLPRGALDPKQIHHRGASVCRRRAPIFTPSSLPESRSTASTTDALFPLSLCRSLTVERQLAAAIGAAILRERSSLDHACKDGNRVGICGNRFRTRHGE